MIPNSQKGSNSSTMATLTTTAIDPNLDLAIKKLLSSTSTQILIRLEGLQLIYSCLVDSGRGTKSNKKEGGGGSLSTKDLELARDHLVTQLSYNSMARGGEGGMLLGSTSIRYLVRLVSKGILEVSSTIHLIVKGLEEYCKHEIREQELDMDYLDTVMSGLHELILMIGTMVFQGKLHSSSIQPLRSYLPPDWFKNHPYVRLLSLDRQEVWTSICRCLRSAFHSNGMGNLVEKFLLFEPLLDKMISSNGRNFGQLQELLEILFLAPVGDGGAEEEYFQMALVSLLELMTAIPLSKPGVRMTILKFVRAWLEKFHAIYPQKFFRVDLPGFLALNLVNLGLYKRTHHPNSLGFSTLEFLEEVSAVVERIGNGRHNFTELLFMCFAYLLSTATSQYEVELLLDLMESSGAQEISKATRCLALYPLIKTLSRSKSGRVRSKCSALIRLWFESTDMSHHHHFEASHTMLLKGTISSHLVSDNKHYVASFCPEAGLAELLALVSILDLSSSKLSEFSHSLTMCRFLVLPRFFSSEGTQALDWLLTNSSLAIEGMDILSLLVFLLRCGISPQFKRHIIFVALPRMAQGPGTHLASRVLRLVQSFDGPNLEAISIRSLGALCLVYSRAWAPLRHKLTSWIRYYKEKAPIGKASRGLVPGHVEVSALVTIREVCTEMPQASQDLFPLLVSLLQYASLPPSATALILSCINLAVSHQVVEAGAVWNLAIASLSAQTSLVDGDDEILVELFRFHQILVPQSVSSEALMPVLDEILNTKVLPAIFPSDNTTPPPLVVAEALKTLLTFPGSVIAGSLPNSPPELVANLLITRAHDFAWAPLLTLLTDQELEQMSRTTFKGSLSQTSRSNAASQDGLEEIRVKIRTSIQEMLAGPCPPGVQASAAMARLSADIANTDQDRKTLSWRTFQSSLSSLSPGLDLSQQSLHFSSWVGFFSTAASESSALNAPASEHHQSADLEMLGRFFKELVSTWQTSQIPTILSNASIALCALPQALLSLGKDALARSYGVQTVSLLLESPSTNLAVLTAMAYGLAGMAPAISHEVTELRDIIGFLERSLQAPEKPGIEWLQLAGLRGLAKVYDVVLGGLMTGISDHVPSLLGGIETALKPQSLDFWIHDSSPSSNEETKLFPIWLGRVLAHTLISSAWFSLSKLHPQLSLPSLPDGILLPGPLLHSLTTRLEKVAWTGSPSDVKDLALVMAIPTLSPLIPHLVEDRQSEAELDSVVMKVLTSAQQSGVNSTYTALGTHFHVRANQHPPIATLGAYNKLLNQHMDLSESSNQLPLISGLSALLGADPLDYMACPPYLLDQASNSKLNQRAIQSIFCACSSNDLTTSRVALVGLGRLAQLSLSPFPPNHTQLFRLVSTHASHLQSQSLGSISNEPSDYNRFPASTSYLRAIHFGIQQSIKSPDLIPTSLVLLQSLSQLDHPLPPVNWLVMLRQLYAQISTPEEILVLIRFCVTRMRYSASLVEFLLFLLSHHTRTLPQLCPTGFEMLVGDPGIGALADLVGLSVSDSLPKHHHRNVGSWANILQPVSLALPRFQESLINLFAYFGTNLDTHHRYFEIFLTTINQHLFSSLSKDDPSYQEISNFFMELQEIARSLLSNSSLISEVSDSILLELSKLARPTPTTVLDLCTLLPFPTYFSCIQTSYEKWGKDIESFRLLIEGILQGLQAYLLSPSTYPSSKLRLVEVIRKFGSSPQDRLAWVVRILDSIILAQDDDKVDPKEGSKDLDKLIMSGVEIICGVVLGNHWEESSSLLPSSTTTESIKDDISPSNSECDIPTLISLTGWSLVQLIESTELASAATSSSSTMGVSPFRLQAQGRFQKFAADLLQLNHAPNSLAWRVMKLWAKYISK